MLDPSAEEPSAPSSVATSGAPSTEALSHQSAAAIPAPTQAFGVSSAMTILGFTGPIGSGCTYIAQAVAGGYGYKYFLLSDIIREYVRETGGDPENVAELQDTGDHLRETKGRAYLVQKTFEKYKQQYPEPSENEKVIIDGIKNEEELQALRQFANTFIISVHADRELRAKRVIKLKRFLDEPAFEEADARDQLEPSIYGQQVKLCDYMSDIIILNNKQVSEKNKRKKDEFIRNIYFKYIEKVENYSANKRTYENPSINELCMSTAYTISKMSSCLKRKVGAVVVEISKANPRLDSPDDIEKNLRIPTIVSSGYNEVPLGSYKCLHDPDYQKCYRDYLQETHATKFKFCPSCGAPISLSLNCKSCNATFNHFVNSCKCGHEIEEKYKCDCGKEVFKEFIPGAKKAPGKLLDMCRALHAEENALLRLMRYSIDHKEMILYTTTQPCNLCANKIVNAGIKKIVFSEPYTMKESDDILRAGGVEVERFEGIKSNAFFKLYK